MPQEDVCQWKSILDESKARQQQSEDTQLCMHHKSQRMSKEKGTAVRMKRRLPNPDRFLLRPLGSYRLKRLRLTASA
jgi:hypothetical protein